MTFKIATKEGIMPMLGEPIQILQHDCFLHSEIDGTKDGVFMDYTITEKSSGLRVAHDLSEEAVVEKAKQLFSKYPQHIWKKKAMNTLSSYGIKYPVNK